MAVAPWSCARCTYWHEGAEAALRSCRVCCAARGEAPPARPPLDTRPPPSAVAEPARATPQACPQEASAPRAPAPAASAAPAHLSAPPPRDAAKDATLPPVPPRCLWLAKEGLEQERKAVEVEAMGVYAEAAFHHRLASTKLSEAAELCPEGHPDKHELSEHALGVSARAVYLESLGGAKPEPLENYVGEISLRMDLSSAPPPTDQEVSVLLARAGTSGESAALSEEGYRLVAALQKPSDMKAFIDRILVADGRKRREVTDSELEAALVGVSSYDTLREALRRADWVELDIDPNMDKLDLAMKFESEARGLEAQGRTQEAKQMYARALAVLQYVHKFDPRTKNAKIKEMIGKRVEEIAAKAA